MSSKRCFTLTGEELMGLVTIEDGETFDLYRSGDDLLVDAWTGGRKRTYRVTQREDEEEPKVELVLPKYTVLWNKPGCLPEMDPYVVVAETPADILRMLKAEVEDLWGEDEENEEWAKVVEEITRDIERAEVGHNHGARVLREVVKAEGMSYGLPDGYVIEAVPA